MISLPKVHLTISFYNKTFTLFAFSKYEIKGDKKIIESTSSFVFQ